MPNIPDLPSPVLSKDEGRTFTLNNPYALEVLCHRERTMLPRFPRLRYPGEVDRGIGVEGEGK